MKSVIGIIYLFYLFIIINAVPSYGDDLFPLTIAHINDFHARFEETDVEGGTCDPGDKCIGGLARVIRTIKTIFREQREKNIHPLYINAGDNFQGTPWYSVGGWKVTSQLMNIKPPDVMVLGNHEFDNGIDGLVPFLENINSQVVVTNMDATDEPEIRGKYLPSAIVTRDKRKIGVIGVIMEQAKDRSKTGKLKFRNESEAIVETAKKLKENRGVNIIIVVSYVGFDVDKVIAEHTGSDVDIIVGGHSHTFLYTGTPPGPEEPEDNYPYVYDHPSGNKVLIVQAACHAKYVGNLTVFFDKDGKVAKYEGAPIYMDSDVEKDKNVLQAMKPWKEIINEKLKNGITDENEADEKDSDESSKKEENDEDEQEYKSNSSKENEKRKGKGKSKGKGKGKGKEKKKGSRKENSDSSKIIDDETEEKDSEHNGENENPGYENNAQSEGDENEKEDKDETNSDTEEDERQNSEKENSNKSSAEEEEGEENEREENDEEQQEEGKLEGNEEEGEEGENENNNNTEDDGIPNNEGYEESDNDQNKENSDEEDKRGNDEEREGSDEENEEVNGEENEETSGEEGKENSDESSEEDSDEESEEDSDEENEVDSDEESEENSDEKSEEDNNTKYSKMDYQLINYIIGLINQYYDYAEQ
ncbi:apyrase-like [Glossina fuscipes]|uniref:apyrase n=1 Tax=Glossina fuscipes TaxID=7396 RepID=A0A8U0WFJ2_9MUSC|nr:apyrase-like [Glossina fuscipes]